MIYKHSIIIDSFLPLHINHITLIQSALKKSDFVTILIPIEIDGKSKQKQEISFEIRQKWLRRSFKERLEIIEGRYVSEDRKILEEKRDKENKGERKGLQYIVNNAVSSFKIPINSVFYLPSDPKSHYLATTLSLSLSLHPIFCQPLPSSSILLSHPLTHWTSLAPLCRPFFVKRICLMGPQSSGKSTLALNLSLLFNTTYVQQTSRWYTDLKPNIEPSDYIEIAKGKLQRQQLKVKTANKIMFVDTDIISTRVYLDMQFPQEGKRLDQQYFNRVIQQNKKTFEVYILIEPKGKGVEDGSRRYCKEDKRKEHWKMIRERLRREGVKVVEIRGGWQENMEECQRIAREILEKY